MKKISELTTLTGGATEGSDLLLIVDLSAGTAGSKKITVQELFRTAAPWQGAVIGGQYGGTGVANTGRTITLGGNLVTAGASITLTAAGATNVTLPTSGTLVTTEQAVRYDTSQALSNPQKLQARENAGAAVAPVVSPWSITDSFQAEIWITAAEPPSDGTELAVEDTVTGRVRVYVFKDSPMGDEIFAEEWAEYLGGRIYNDFPDLLDETDSDGEIMVVKAQGGYRANYLRMRVVSGSNMQVRPWTPTGIGAPADTGTWVNMRGGSDIAGEIGQGAVTTVGGARRIWRCVRSDTSIPERTQYEWIEEATQRGTAGYLDAQRAAEEVLWSLHRVVRLPFSAAFVSGTAASAAAYQVLGTMVTGGTSNGATSRAILGPMSNHAPDSTGLGMPLTTRLRFSLIGEFAATAAANGGRLRFVVGVNAGAPALANANGLAAKGFGVEIEHDAVDAAERIRIISHNGTTFTASGWAQFRSGFSRRSGIILDYWSGTLRLYVSQDSVPGARPGEYPVLTWSGPTGDLSGGYCALEAVAPSAGAATSNVHLRAKVRECVLLIG